MNKQERKENGNYPSFLRHYRAKLDTNMQGLIQKQRILAMFNQMKDPQKP